MDELSALRYTRIAMLLHWLTVLAVTGLFAIGWYMVDLPKGPLRGYWFALHKSIGLSLAALIVLRLAWRLGHAPPPLPAHVPAWQRHLAHGVHLGFYLLLLAQPSSGYLSSSFSGYQTRWFGVPLPDWGWRDAPLNEFFTELHVLCSIALLVLIGVHLAGFLSHLVQGDRALARRMWPW